MIVLKINKPKNKKEYPEWVSPDMDYLNGAEFTYLPHRVLTGPGDPVYRLNFGQSYLTPMEESDSMEESRNYSWGLNTKWLEVVRTDGEDLNKLEELGIKVPGIFKVGPITLSTIGTYHDSTKN